MNKLIKLSCFILAITSIAITASIGNIDGNIITGNGKAEYQLLSNAVNTVNRLKTQKASRHITEKEYSFKVNNILAMLRNKGLNIR